MSNIINADQYIKAGDKVYKVAGGGASGRNIITANSREELPDPSTVAEGTIALVPSSSRIFDFSEIGAFASLTDTPEAITVSADYQFIVDLIDAIKNRPFVVSMPMRMSSAGSDAFTITAVCTGMEVAMIGGGSQMQFTFSGTINMISLQLIVRVSPIDDVVIVNVDTFAVSATTPAMSV